MKELLVYEDTQDGLTMWLEMVKTYDKGGSANLRIQMLESVISIPFHRSYVGGLTQFVDDYETAFVELSLILDVDTWDKDSNKKRRLLQNVASASLSWLPHLAKSLDFEDVCQLLREHALKMEHRAKETAIKKEFLTNLGIRHWRLRLTYPGYSQIFGINYQVMSRT